MHSLVVRMSTSDADLAFLSLVLEEENTQRRPLPIDTLIALSAFRRQRRLKRSELAHFIPKGRDGAGRVLEALVERGLIQPHGMGRGRTYTLSPRIYRSLGQPAEYTRQAGLETMQQEQMVINFVRQHGEIRRKDVMDLCQLSQDQAYRLLRRLTAEGILQTVGKKKASFYTLGIDE